MATNEKTLEEMGFDKFNRRSNFAHVSGGLRNNRLRAGLFAGGILPKDTIIGIGSDKFEINAKEGRMTLHDGTNYRIVIGQKPDGTLAVEMSDVGYDVFRAYEGEKLLSTQDHDDWTEYNPGNFSYTNANRIAIANYTGTDLFQKGDRIKITQTTTKYLNITNVAATYIDVTGGTDYTVANAAITEFFKSREVLPSGFASTFTWAPALSVVTGTIAGISYIVAEYWILGDRVECDISAQFTIGGGGGSEVIVALPPVANAYNYGASGAWSAGYGFVHTPANDFAANVYFPSGETTLDYCGFTPIDNVFPDGACAITGRIIYKLA